MREAPSTDGQNRLTIVIPGFRSEYLRDTLESLRSQTCQHFDVLVADDASPDDIHSVVESIRAGLDLRYVRFAQNLGSRYVTAHWNRAVRLTASPWALLLGDDDCLDPEVVERFFAALDETQERFDLYRFNTRRIDNNGVILCNEPEHPAVESSFDFVGARFRGERSSYTCEYFFRRSAWDRIGGFVSFPLAWCSDDATWVALGAKTGIKTITGARASWRLSGRNISSPQPELAARKLRAQSEYLGWLAENLPGVAEMDDTQRAELLRGADCWFYGALWRSKCYLPLRDAIAMAFQLDKFTGDGAIPHFLRLLKHNGGWVRGRWY